MVRKTLTKLYNKMMMSPTSKNKFYEKFIRWQVLGIIERKLYMPSEDSRWGKFKKGVWSFRVLIATILLITASMVTTYHFGIKSRNSEFTELSNVIDNKDQTINNDIKQKVALLNVIRDKNSQIDSLSTYLESREYLEFMIQKRAKIDDFELNMSRVSDDILFLMVEQADKYEIPYTIYFRLIDKESGFKFIPNHTGSGAFGYMQLMPATFKSYANKLGLEGGHTKVNNILVGSYMLYKNHNDWLSKGKSDYDAWRFCLAEYNTGEGNMQIKNDAGKVTGYFVPNYTKSYISFIMKYYPKD